MDRLDSLATSISSISLYDIKAMYNQAKNAVFNVSEMEAKVLEATNDEPWGASSTLMQDIAQGTFNFQQFNEIMPSIYTRFMEKEARQWRQIYKALQLLEYLVKHGSERVVDDARSHISTLKMLRNFHYIDEKGKDQGLNVRNRARELVEFLSDVETIRTERRKAKINRHKYTGTGNDPLSFTSGGSRYGGFGNDNFVGGTGGYYGDRMSGRDDFGGSSGGSSNYRDGTGRRDFEEYTAGDDETVVRRSNSVNNGHNTSRLTATPASPPRTQAASALQKQKEPEIDLLGGFDEEPAAASGLRAASTNNTNKALPSLTTSIDDDDFADFQVAPTSPTHSSTSSKPTLLEMLSSSPPQATALPVAASKPVVTSSTLRNTSFNTLAATATTGKAVNAAQVAPTPSNLWAASRPLSPTGLSRTTARTSSAGSRASMSSVPTPSKGFSGFEDLWSMSLGSTSSGPGDKSLSSGKSIKDLEKEKAGAGIWASSQRPATAAPIGMGGALGNNFGNFGPVKPGGGSAAGGGDDLLL
ncbi:hypothetical protein PISMIDRAFT_188999 [Pisolithus microcarpus 441]|uniref:ENTH domain-containing protein n=1 Tax=Pisolithus microcarpus 441 TaxID=765257 RepID=A0A0C9ZE42_9AGAM|nr:hypothetical protein PISMIDRAFT_188999 [Pisolithus microcarpus 441]